MTFHTFTTTNLPPSQLNENFKSGLVSDIRSITEQDDYATDTETDTNFDYDASADVYTATNATSTLVNNFESLFPSKAEIWQNNITYATGFVKYYYAVFTVVDEVNDEAVNATLWERDGTGTLSETGTDLGTASYLRLASAATGTDENHILRFKTNLEADVNTYVFRLYINAITNPKIRLNDGVSTVDLLTFDNSTRNVRLYFDWTAGSELAYVAYNGGAYSSIDISSLTSGTIELEVFGSTNGGNALDFKMYYMRKITGSESATPAFSYSADDGSNYTVVDSDGFTTLTTNIDSNPTRKLSVTVGATEVVEVYGAESGAYNF